MSHEKDQRIHIHFHHASGDYIFLGFNPNRKDRVIITTPDESIVGTVKIDCCYPVGHSWDDLQQNHLATETSSPSAAQ